MYLQVRINFSLNFILEMCLIVSFVWVISRGLWFICTFTETDIYKFTDTNIVVREKNIQYVILIPRIWSFLSLECHITSVTSPSASALNVKWTSFTDATNYFLDLRIVNDTSVAPVVVTLPASSTQRLVQGLRPGRFYDITLKVFKFYYVVCTNSKQSYTGKIHVYITKIRQLHK